VRLLRRLLSRLKLPGTPQRVAELSLQPTLTPARPPREGQEVWGASRSAPDGWRLIGLDESPLLGPGMPGATPDIGPDLPGALDSQQIGRSFLPQL
jgi:hypothetical protein